MPIELNCAGCQEPLGVAAPAAGSSVLPVGCKGCGSVYFGSAVAGGSDAASPPWKLSLEQRGRDTLCENNSERIKSTFDLLTGVSYDDAIKGHSIRYNVSLPVLLVPTDGQHRIFGDPVPATLRDLSTGGVCVLTETSPTLPMALIDFTPAGIEAVQLLAKVQWTQRIGSFSEVGFRFVNPSDE